MINERQHTGQRGAPQVRGNHDPDPGHAVYHRAGDRGEKQHRQDLGDDRTGDPKPGSGQPEHQHHQGDRVHGVTPPEMVCAANKRR